MKKIIAIILALVTLTFISCSSDSGSNNSSNGGKAIEADMYNTVKIDAVNYDIANIEGVEKLGETGVLYAFCSSAKNANATISSLNAMLGESVPTYDENDSKHLILTVVTLGEGEKSTYKVDKVEMGDNAAINVYVVTSGGKTEDTRVGTYHFVRINTPVSSKVNVYLDGEIVTK